MSPRFPNSYLRFVDLFNEGRYWESHEVLEGPWRENQSTYYKGMIIYASAFVHARRGNPRGVRKQLRKAERYLKEYAPYYMGIDVDAILAHIERCLAVVDVSDPPEGESLGASIDFPELVIDLARVRGEEPELKGPENP